MREDLAPLHDLRETFTGTFVRFGTYSSYGYLKKTLLIRDVKDAGGKVVSDHLWFNLTRGFEALALQPGDLVIFVARVTRYTKGYRGRRPTVFDKPIEVDYRLSRPTEVRKQPAGMSRPGA